MKTRTLFSGVVAAGLTLAFMPLGCGGAAEDYEVVSRPPAPEQAAAPAGQEQIPEATARQSKTCIERGAGRLPKSSAARFDVEPNDGGKVVKIELRGTTIRDTAVEECLREAIADMTVPERALRRRSSGPVSGGERMMREQRGPIGSESGSENPFVLWLFVEAVGVETLIEVGVGAIAAVGTILISNKKKDECADKYTACMDTPLGNLQVDKWGMTVCATCLKLCNRDGEWPLGFEKSRGWQTCR